jgi:ankyrin repeat protein
MFWGYTVSACNVTLSHVNLFTTFKDLVQPFKHSLSNDMPMEPDSTDATGLTAIPYEEDWEEEDNTNVTRHCDELQAACYQGHTDIVRVLLDQNADFDAQSENYGTALQAASSEGYEKIVEILLEEGADVEAQSSLHGAAIHAAALEGHYNVVRMLCNAGANVNAQGGEYGDALQAASSGGYSRIVRLLLDNGVDVNVQGYRQLHLDVTMELQPS